MSVIFKPFSVFFYVIRLLVIVNRLRVKMYWLASLYQFCNHVIGTRYLLAFQQVSFVLDKMQLEVFYLSRTFVVLIWNGIPNPKKNKMENTVYSYQSAIILRWAIIFDNHGASVPKLSSRNSPGYGNTRWVECINNPASQRTTIYVNGNQSRYQVKEEPLPTTNDCSARWKLPYDSRLSA